MEFPTTVREVRKKDLVRKKDGRPFTLYEITDASNTTWQTGRRDLAEEANNLIGQAVVIQGHTDQNGDYTNYYLDDIRGAGAVLPDPSSAFGPPPGAFSEARTVVQPQQPPVQPQPILAGVTEAQKQVYIHRQVAAKVAAKISPSASEFWANVEALTVYFNTGQQPAVIPGPSTIDAGSVAGPPQGNQFVPESAYAGAQELASTYGGDDDIPF